MRDLYRRRERVTREVGRYVLHLKHNETFGREGMLHPNRKDLYTWSLATSTWPLRRGANLITQVTHYNERRGLDSCLHWPFPASQFNFPPFLFVFIETSFLLKLSGQFCILLFLIFFLSFLTSFFFFELIPSFLFFSSSFFIDNKFYFFRL